VTSPCSFDLDAGMVYSCADGMRLCGDYYRPRGIAAVPIVVAVHGGAWKTGSARFYQYWGPFLAASGIALLAIDYRLVDGTLNRHPAAVRDVCAALEFVRAHACRLGVDPDRIGLIGDSAGAHLAALAALAGDSPLFARSGSGDAAAGHTIAIKAVVGVYGVYDLLAQWQHDLVARPRDQVTEAWMGVSPIEDRLSFFAASPLAHVTRRRNKTAFLVAWGMADDIVDWETQSKPFVAALKQAGFFVRTVPITDAPHFWMSDPLDQPHGHAARLAPSLLRFLHERL
jgi:acetyl esterase/lipase